MLRVRKNWMAFVASLVVVPALMAQAPNEPGPEHKKLKELEGTWDAVMKMGDMESKGTIVYKMELGGLWLSSQFEGEFGGQKFGGRGLDSYDPVRKKYVSVWVDSMSTSPMMTEGNYDKDGKVMTMAGEGPGEDGKPTKYRMTTEHKDKNKLFWSMYMGEGATEPAFTITYTQHTARPRTRSSRPPRKRMNCPPRKRPNRPL